MQCPVTNWAPLCTLCKGAQAEHESHLQICDWSSVKCFWVVYESYPGLRVECWKRSVEVHIFPFLSARMIGSLRVMERFVAELFALCDKDVMLFGEAHPWRNIWGHCHWKSRFQRPSGDDWIIVLEKVQHLQAWFCCKGLPRFSICRPDFDVIGSVSAIADLNLDVNDWFSANAFLSSVAFSILMCACLSTMHLMLTSDFLVSTAKLH